MNSLSYKEDKGIPHELMWLCAELIGYRSHYLLLVTLRALTVRMSLVFLDPIN